MEPLIPPIASPHGSGDSQSLVPLDGSEGLSLIYEVSSWSVRARWRITARSTTKAMLVIPFLVLMELFILPFVPLTFILSFIGNLIVCNTRGTVTITLNQTGCREKFKGQLTPLSIRWKRVQRVLEWKGDVCFVTFGGGCFIPREAFASREEAREFVALARGLKQTRGAAWRDEWNGRLFGYGVERNNPA